MKTKRFTEDELTELRNNPYTYKATPGKIQFTAAFKERFWKEYNAGKRPEDIVKDCGYDPEILGRSRINGIQLHIREQFIQDGGFHEGRRPNAPRDKAENKMSASPEEEIRQLRGEVKYLRQEVDFLKKISSIRTSGKREKS